MSLADDIQDDLKTAMKERDKVKTSTLRLALAGIKNLRAQAGHGEDVSDEEVLAIFTKEAKRRRESLETYLEAGRNDLAAAEQAELEVLETYLPEPLSEDELKKLVDETIEEVGASSPGDIGKVMSTLMPKLQGRADGRVIQRIVTGALSQD